MCLDSLWKFSWCVLCEVFGLFIDLLHRQDIGVFDAVWWCFRRYRGEARQEELRVGRNGATAAFNSWSRLCFLCYAQKPDRLAISEMSDKDKSSIGEGTERSNRLVKEAMLLTTVDSRNRHFCGDLFLSQFDHSLHRCGCLLFFWRSWGHA